MVLFVVLPSGTRNESCDLASKFFSSFLPCEIHARLRTLLRTRAPIAGGDSGD